MLSKYTAAYVSDERFVLALAAGDYEV